MSKATLGGQAIADWGREHIGCGYIFGAKGQKCSLEFRKIQATQYPEYKDKILGKEGAQWDGKPCYDCAQYTKAAVKTAGGVLPSGATSQWNTGAAWDEKGTLDTMPDEVGLILYRKSASGSDMSHTGIYLGDGKTAEAQGHATGCVLRDLAAGSWTHWGRHVIATEQAAEEHDSGEVEPDIVLFEAYVSTTTGRLNLRNGASSKHEIIGRIPQNHVLEVLDDEDATWWKVRWGDLEGWVAAQYLARIEQEELEEAGETVTIPRALLMDLRLRIDALLGVDA